jgi:hypothetical protein
VRAAGLTPPDGEEGRGTAWMVWREGLAAEFVVATGFGPRTVGTSAELLAALDVVEEPCEFPDVKWPGVMVSVVAGSGEWIPQKLSTLP